MLVFCISFVSSIDVKDLEENKPVVIYKDSTSTVYSLKLGNNIDYTNVSSLMKSEFIKPSISLDEEFPIEINSFNLTWIDINFTYLDKYKKQDVPYKILNRSNPEQVLWEGTINQNRANKIAMKFTTRSLGDKIDIFDIIVKYGFNSTTLRFNISNNIAKDTFISTQNPADNFGTETYFNVLNYTGGLMNGLIRFNITGVPTTINSAILYLYSSFVGVSSSSEYQNITVLEIDPLYGWADTVTNNTFDFSKVNYSGSYPVNKINQSTGDEGWYLWNITDIVSRAKANSYNNISLFVTVRIGLASTSGDVIQFRSSDNAQPQRPTLEIIYDTVTATNCTYTSGNYIVPCSLNCNLSVINLARNNFTFYGSGTISGFRNLTNYTFGMISGINTTDKCNVNN
jgi:hypothetical protein